MTARPAPKRRAYWLKMLHQWHWVSSALCLLGMLGFAITGLTLNNAAHIESQARVNSRHERLPPQMLAALRQAGPAGQASSASRRGKPSAPLPGTVARWLSDKLDIPVPDTPAEWSSDEVYVSMPRPGGDAWMSVDLADGAIEYERTDRGVIAYLNDLHKGRHTGVGWSWFLDIFACACLVFSLTGLLLLKLHAGHRRATWPMVGLGLLIPVLLAATLMH
jgi:hypothetical protein